MRLRATGYPVTVLASALVFTACALSASPSASPSLPAGNVCPEARVRNLPSTFSLQSAVSVDIPDQPSGLRRTYADPAGREFSILSGIEGELGGQDSGRRVAVRGHEARILVNAQTDTLLAVWLENPPDRPCSQYMAIGTGLGLDELLGYVSRIR